jgi:hypothetical protein
MRNATVMRWIEQAEARQVLSAALFERAPTVPRSTAAGHLMAQMLPRLRSWFGEGRPMGTPVGQTQPALIRQPDYRAQPAARR